MRIRADHQLDDILRPHVSRAGAQPAGTDVKDAASVHRADAASVHRDALDWLDA